jgi:putative transposase
MQYERKKSDDSQYINKLDELTQKHVNIGFWQCYHRIRQTDKNINHKKLYRIYTSMKLNIRRRRKKRLPTRLALQLSRCTAINQHWSMDFVSDKLVDGRSFRILNIIDDYNRESLYLDTSLPSARVIRSIETVAKHRGYPSNIRIDNGPEFISTALQLYCERHHINLQYIQPGKPTQNAYVERNNGSMRREVLDAYLFTSLTHARHLLYNWQYDYNNHRPHKSLNYFTPLQYATKEQAT